VAVALGAAHTAQAGLFKNTVRALELAGFQFIGEKNPLSGGAELQVVRNFTNDTLDFGATELTLNGPLQLTFETGGRGLEVLDFSLSTVNQPFSYTLISDVGGQATQVDGNFLLNATGSMNSFGWYDFEFEYSVRETITQDGRFADGEEFVDFDIGPIDVSGNIFADMLAVLLDPVFQVLGTENIFTSFSGRYQAMDELNRRMTDAGLTNVGLKSFREFSGTASLADLGLGRGTASASMVDAGRPDLGDGRMGPSYVPDPSTLLLLAAGVPALHVLRRRRA
jgi:hypothetical protein